MRLLDQLMGVSASPYYLTSLGGTHDVAAMHDVAFTLDVTVTHGVAGTDEEGITLITETFSVYFQNLSNSIKYL